MKKLTLTLVLSVVSTIVMAFTTMKRAVIERPVLVEPSRPLALVMPLSEINITVPKVELESKTHTAFLKDLGMRESSGNYKAVNRYGYLGKYQFGRSTLNSLGYRNVSNRQFLSSPEIQEQAMRELLIHNKRVLRREIKKYSGKTINGILITESGILAAAHLGGAGNVKHWFRKGSDFKDANGTSILTYMIKFSGYNLNI